MSKLQQKITRHATKLGSVIYAQGNKRKSRQEKLSLGLDIRLNKDFQGAMTMYRGCLL